MKLGIIYAGQGSQVVGMGKSFYPHEIFDQNEDLKELCFNGPLEKLSYTPYTQPCMVMVATIITDLLKEHGIVPDYTAGLSLGEYSALYCAGVFKRQQVIDLARFRGKVMQEAVSEIESEMIAVLGMKEELLQDLCHQASSLGVVSISNYNCPGQLVVAGEKKAVEKVKELALENKARRVIALNTSGPFHTSLLKEASLALKERFKKEYDETSEALEWHIETLVNFGGDSTHKIYKAMIEVINDIINDAPSTDKDGMIEYLQEMI